jgi:hypothetical protein
LSATTAFANKWPANHCLPEKSTHVCFHESVEPGQMAPASAGNSSPTRFKVNISEAADYILLTQTVESAGAALGPKLPELALRCFSQVGAATDEREIPGPL